MSQCGVSMHTHLGPNRVRHRMPALFVGWRLLETLWMHVATVVALRH
jgi:hypothetical protein